LFLLRLLRLTFSGKAPFGFLFSQVRCINYKEHLLSQQDNQLRFAIHFNTGEILGDYWIARKTGGM